VDSFGSGHGPVAGSCEHGNEPSDSIKGGEFIDYLSDLACEGGLCYLELVYQLLGRRYSALLTLPRHCGH